jgi:hypothetical protein
LYDSRSYFSHKSLIKGERGRDGERGREGEMGRGGEMRPLAKVLLIKFWDGLEAHPTRKKIFVEWASSPS